MSLCSEINSAHSSGLPTTGPLFQVAQLVEAQVDGQLLLHAPAAVQLGGVLGAFPGLSYGGFTVGGHTDAAVAGIEAVGSRTGLFKFVPVDLGEGLVVGPADVGPDETGVGDAGGPGGGPETLAGEPDGGGGGSGRE